MSSLKNPGWFSEDNSENRGERRRALYIGERVVCCIKKKQTTYNFEVVDISPQGLALVQGRNQQPVPEFTVDEIVDLEFTKNHKDWRVQGRIANLGFMNVQGEKKQRYGIQFTLDVWKSYTEFTKALGKELILCKSYIRPQISAEDPFFFKEMILFQCNGFTAEGIDLVASSRWKSILPNQYLELDVFIPGKKSFRILCRNSANFYQSPWKDRFRIYLEYIEVPIDYNQAVCEYLVMMNPKVTTDRLRSIGFLPGNFDHACYLQKAEYNEEMFPKSEYQPSLLAGPESGPIPQRDEIQNISRELSCKLGANYIAYFNLVFFEGEISVESLHPLQAGIPSDLIRKSHIILTNLIVSKKVLLSDFLIPMLQQIIRISAQAKSRNLFIIVNDGLVSILKKIGFQSVRLSGRQLPPKNRMMVLEVNSVLNNQHLMVDGSTWNRVYADINKFLGRVPPSANKNVMTYKFPKK